MGAYQLCAKIGQGGMARVFLAVAGDRLGRRRYVAVKCLRDELATDRRFLDMFVDEVRLASQVAHPNVASAFDFGVAEGVPYLVMEHLSGQRLGAVRQQLTAQPGACPPGLRSGIVARLMADACEGVHAIHEARDLDGDPLNIIHRDICPSNLFVTYAGAVSVLDFGVARSSGQRHTTRAGVVKGKYSYLAPELARGGAPNRHSDVWSLGVVAWEMLTGERLFAGDTDIEVLRAIDGGKEIAAPSKVLGSGSDLVDEVLMCALSRDPCERFDTARDFGKLLTQLLVETGQAVGLAEIAELMDELFPRAQEETRDLYEAAEALEAPLLKLEDDAEYSIDIIHSDADDEDSFGDDLPEDRPTRSLVRRVVAIGVAVLLFAFSSALDCRPREAIATTSAATESSRENPPNARPRSVGLGHAMPIGMEPNKKSSDQPDTANQPSDDDQGRSRREFIELEPELVRIIEMATD